ncbi:hypothetical protein CRG98_013772 [Punica granatum]|uniref:Uncharacterized protein n=1 Tax=Punica granatum TaxID=22663 RepID=A0A2I0KBC1_PUNGR|nr:hypothetical protein CRG98_013772 [Punica granatum]
MRGRSRQSASSTPPPRSSIPTKNAGDLDGRLQSYKENRKRMRGRSRQSATSMPPPRSSVPTKNAGDLDGRLQVRDPRSIRGWGQ